MAVLDFVFPKFCLECKSPGKYLCPLCLERVRPARPHRLPRGFSGLDRVFSAWQYQGVIRKTILALKYRFGRDITWELTSAFASEIKERRFWPKKAVLVPIPLHPRRQRWRGFNQSEEIGKILAQEMGWDFESRFLERKIARAPQMELKGKARRENIRGVFAVGPLKPAANDKRFFILFDDVWTTGSTVKEAAQVLKKGGASKVWGLTIARS